MIKRLKGVVVMKISNEMEKKLNQQINKELESSYLYLSMATWFTKEDFTGFAHWMQKQASEELEHAMKMIAYVQERSGRVLLDAIPTPKHTWDTPMQAFEDTLVHEMDVTKRIYDLVGSAEKENDLASVSFLDWFVSEQVEEEASVNKIIAILNKVGASPIGVFTLDRQLAAR